MKLTRLLLFNLIFFSTPSFSQESIPDTTALRIELSESIKSYNRFTGAYANIYNGGEYIPYIFKMEGHPFFESDKLTNGWISYEGWLYENIPMQYDLKRNLVIIQTYEGNHKIYLQNNVIDSFHFLNHTFIRVKDSTEQLDSTAFYDLLFNNHIQVLANRKKNFREVIKENDIVRIFYKQDQDYIHKANRYFAVSNRRDVFRVLNTKKHEIKSYLHQQKIKFRKNNFEEALVIAAKIYDQLSY